MIENALALSIQYSLYCLDLRIIRLSKLHDWDSIGTRKDMGETVVMIQRHKDCPSDPDVEPFLDFKDISALNLFTRIIYTDHHRVIDLGSTPPSGCDVVIE